MYFSPLQGIGCGKCVNICCIRHSTFTRPQDYVTGSHSRNMEMPTVSSQAADRQPLPLLKPGSSMALLVAEDQGFILIYGITAELAIHVARRRFTLTHPYTRSLHGAISRCWSLHRLCNEFEIRTVLGYGLVYPNSRSIYIVQVVSAGPRAKYPRCRRSIGPVRSAPSSNQSGDCRSSSSTSNNNDNNRLSEWVFIPITPLCQQDSWALSSLSCHRCRSS
jgi:hypothetical protein